MSNSTSFPQHRRGTGSPALAYILAVMIATAAISAYILGVDIYGRWQDKVLRARLEAALQVLVNAPSPQHVDDDVWKVGVSQTQASCFAVFAPYHGVSRADRKRFVAQLERKVECSSASEVIEWTWEQIKAASPAGQLHYKHYIYYREMWLGYE